MTAAAATRPALSDRFSACFPERRAIGRTPVGDGEYCRRGRGVPDDAAQGFEKRRSMRAGKAYLSSLGTTGVLLVCSLLLLAIVGSIVTYHRWPTGARADAPVVLIGGAHSQQELPRVQIQRVASVRTQPHRAGARRALPAMRATARGAAPRGHIVSDLPAPAVTPRGPRSIEPAPSTQPRPAASERGRGNRTPQQEQPPLRTVTATLLVAAPPIGPLPEAPAAMERELAAAFSGDRSAAAPRAR
jgi:hypothetical protein